MLDLFLTWLPSGTRRGTAQNPQPSIHEGVANIPLARCPSTTAGRYFAPGTDELSCIVRGARAAHPRTKLDLKPAGNSSVERDLQALHSVIRATNIDRRWERRQKGRPVRGVAEAGLHRRGVDHEVMFAVGGRRPHPAAAVARRPHPAAAAEPVAAAAAPAAPAYPAPTPAPAPATPLPTTSGVAISGAAAAAACATGAGAAPHRHETRVPGLATNAPNQRRGGG